ncbi:MAG: hypothetical protein AAFN10_22590 [Bacteroidota bacterium]
MYYRANNQLAQIILANGLTEVSDRFDDGRREFRLKANGKRYIRLQDAHISDNVAQIECEHLDAEQLRLLLSLHLMHPISRKELLRICGPDLPQIQAFVANLEYGVCAGNTCHKLSINVLDTLQQIKLLQSAELTLV